MIKKTTALFLLAVLTAALLTVCAPEKKETDRSGPPAYTDYIDAGKRIAVQLGDIYTDMARDVFKTIASEYTTPADMLEALRSGKIDAALLDSSYIKPLIDSGSYPDLDYLWVPKEVFANESAPLFHTDALRTKYNEWLTVITADGTLDEMKGRWIGVPLPNEEDVPRFELTGKNGTLKVCDTGNYPPFIYYDANGEPTGFDYEMISRFAQYLDMKIEIAMMSYGAILPFVVSGKADMSACLYTVTEERGQGAIFGDPCIVSLGVLVVQKKGGTADTVRDYTDFIGKRFATLTGSVYDAIADNRFNASEKLYFNTTTDQLQAVNLGKADAALIGDVVTMVSLSNDNFKGLSTVEVPLEGLNFEYAVFSSNQQIIDKYNVFMKTIKANGIYDQMYDNWFSSYDINKEIPKIELSNKNGTLKVAINATYPPFVYLGGNGKWSGFDIEQFHRFAQFLEMDIEFADMDFGGMIPYMLSGRADIASSIYVTEERKKSVIFGDPCYISRTVLIYKKPAEVSAAQASAEKTSFRSWLQTGIQRNLITDNRWKMIADGLGVTLIIAFSAQLFGTIWACFVCFVLTRRNKFVKRLGNLYCGLIHGTPIVVLLMITYYIIFGNANISNVLVAVAAFTMITGAGVAANLSGAIGTVDPVEIEAARSIGYPAFKAFLRVTLPQAVCRALPAYTNGFIELVKATAIVGYIAIQDLTRAGDIIRSRTYDAYFPLLFVAVIYLTVTSVCVQLFKLAVKKINRGGAA